MEMNKKSVAKIAYCLVGLAVVAWSYFGQELGSEASIAAYKFMSWYAFPISFPVSFLFFFVFASLKLPNLLAIVPPVAMLAAGFFQWFYFVPWIVRRVRDWRNRGKGPASS